MKEDVLHRNLGQKVVGLGESASRILLKIALGSFVLVMGQMKAESRPDGYIIQNGSTIQYW